MTDRKRCREREWRDYTTLTLARRMCRDCDVLQDAGAKTRRLNAGVPGRG